MKNKAYYKSKLGLLEVKRSENGITEINFAKNRDESNKEVHPQLKRCITQLREYFSGQREEFSLSLDLKGTNFQKQVWRELIKIPFGETRSYLDIARGIENKKAVRAVGGAVGSNKIAIIIPCHRVIGSDGSLTGYGGGIEKKEWLLNHEARW